MNDLIEQLNNWTAQKVIANPVPQPVLDFMSVIFDGRPFEVRRISVNNDRNVCEVEVSWAARGFVHDEGYEIPISCFKHADIKKSAALWKAREAVRIARESKEECEGELIAANDRLEKLMDALSAIEAAP